MCAACVRCCTRLQSLHEWVCDVVTSWKQAIFISVFVSLRRTNQVPKTNFHFKYLSLDRMRAMFINRFFLSSSGFGTVFSLAALRCLFSVDWSTRSEVIKLFAQRWQRQMDDGKKRIKRSKFACIKCHCCRCHFNIVRARMCRLCCLVCCLSFSAFLIAVKV